MPTYLARYIVVKQKAQEVLALVVVAMGENRNMKIPTHNFPRKHLRFFNY